MTNQEAADSMRKAAKKLTAWSESVKHLTAEDLLRLHGAFTREAQRLFQDAAQLAPAISPAEARE